MLETKPPPPESLDAILALQLTVAWAGEAACDPPRLAWWKSDLVDPEGGGDLFARLVPKTAPWASLALVREAARRVDEASRQKLASPDAAWTLFHFGFTIDERLADRLAWHRQHQHDPKDVLGPHFLVGTPWSKQAFEAAVGKLGKPKVTVTPAGRKFELAGASPIEAAPLLVAALLPLAPAYPMPFIEVVG
jgi:hypothetical protein